MASRSQGLRIVISGDTSQLNRSLSRADRQLSKFGKQTSLQGRLASGGFSRMAVAATGTAAAIGGLAAGAGVLGKRVIGLASDAEETASKFNTVFATSAKTARKELNAFSRATGTSRFELREQAAQLQALIRPMGLTATRAGDLSVGLTKLATDLASFNNSSVQEAITALQSGLVGEAEPLRRFGVQLSAARVQAVAYAKGIAEQGAELTAAQKAQAAYAIILKDTKLAQGDATRTSDSFANQLKRFKGIVTDTATELGVKLLPAAKDALVAVNGFVRGVVEGEGAGGRFRDRVTSAFEAVKPVVADLARNIAGVGKAFAPLLTAVGSVALKLGGLALQIATSRAGLVLMGAAVGALVGRMAGLAVAFTVTKIAGFITSIRTGVLVIQAMGGAAAAAATAMRSLTVATAASGIGLAAVAVGTVVGALLALKGNSDRAKVSADQLTQAMRNQADAMRAVRDIDIDVAQRKTNVKAANVAVTQAEQRLRDVRRDANATATDIKQAEVDLEQARIQQTRAQRELGDAETDGRRKREDLSKATNEYRAVQSQMREGIRATISDREREVQKINRQIAHMRDLGVDTTQAERKAAGLRAEIRRLRSKDITITTLLKFNVPSDLSALEPLPNTFPSGGPSLDEFVTAGARKKARAKAREFSRNIIPGGQRLGSRGASGVDAFTPISLRMGLSGARGPGQSFRAGDDGFHGQNRARDHSGPAGAMMRFARYLFSNFGSRLKELIYTPMGTGIKNGRPVSIRGFYGGKVAADHFDHVHVAMRRGGKVPGEGRGDKIPAMLEPGEFVIRKQVVEKFGPTFFTSMNDDRLRYLQGGGMARRDAHGVTAFRRRLIDRAARKFGISPAILYGLYGAESNFGRNLGPSSAGARGPFQFMPATARAYGIENINSFAETVVAAAKYLGRYKNRGVAGMLAAYNAGPAGNPNNPETQRYIPKVRNLARAFRTSGGSSGGVRPRTRAKSPRAGLNRPTGPSLEQQLATIDVRAAEAERTTGSEDDIAALTAKRGVTQARLNKVTSAIRSKRFRKFRPETKLRLTQERASLLRDLGQMDTDLTALRAPAESGEDPNQALIDSNNALIEAQERARQAAEDQAAAERERAEAERQRMAVFEQIRDEIKRNTDFAQSVTATSNAQITKSLTDLISGQLAGFGIAGRALTAGSGSLARY